MFKRLLFSLLALSAMTAWADVPFRNHRYDGFKVIDTDSTQIVFIGNSITNMHEWWEAFADHRVINRGVSGALSHETLANLESILAGRPAKAFLMIGTNDLATSGCNTAAHVATNVRHILKRFRSESPRTEIFVQSILPSRLRNLSLQRQTNDSLRKICGEMDVTYVDLWDKLADVAQSGNNTHTLDGLHLTASGYAIWCQAIAPLVGLNTVYSDATTDKTGSLGGSYGMRTSYFAALPVHEGDVLIIGDEMVHGGEWHELLHSPRVKNRGNGWGLNGGEIAVVAKELPLILGNCSKTGYPEQIFFYNGAGEVSNTATAIADIMAAYRANVTTTRTLAPTTTIRLLPVIPGIASAEILSRTVTFNDSLRAYAAATEGVEFVDCYDLFYPGGTVDKRYFQGRYVNGPGYAKLSQVIAPYIEGATATTDSAANAALARFNARTTLASTDNTVIKTSATSASSGWTLSHSNTPGLFIVSSGNVQLNQTQSGQGFASTTGVLKKHL